MPPRRRVQETPQIRSKVSSPSRIRKSIVAATFFGLIAGQVLAQCENCLGPEKKSISLEVRTDGPEDSKISYENLNAEDFDECRANIYIKLRQQWGDISLELLREKILGSDILVDYERVYIEMVESNFEGVLDSLDQDNQWAPYSLFFKQNAIIPFYHSDHEDFLLDQHQDYYTNSNPNSFWMIPKPEQPDSTDFPIKFMFNSLYVPVVEMAVDFKTTNWMYVAMMGEIKKAMTVNDDQVKGHNFNYDHPLHENRLKFKGLLISMAAMVQWYPYLESIIQDPLWQKAIEEGAYDVLIEANAGIFPLNADQTSLAERRYGHFICLASGILMRNVLEENTALLFADEQYQQEISLKLDQIWQAVVANVE